MFCHFSSLRDNQNVTTFALPKQNRYRRDARAVEWGGLENR